jgi:hypothetical protein
MIVRMDDGGPVGAALERAAQARQQAMALRQRLDGSRTHLAHTEQRVEELRGRLQHEQEDVERLESFSATRIWAALKGARASDLERESAERDAARYAVADAEARRDVARREVDALAAELGRLGDVDAGYRDALAAKETWLAGNGSPAAARLSAIAEELGVLAARQAETQEAHAAGVAARAQLVQAQQLLGSARSWSTWDTFGGGGLLTDMMKYDRLDQVTATLHGADLALGSFSRELADVGIAAVAGVQVDGMTRAFDIFFDNIFTDMAVRSRIQDAQQRVAGTLASVDRTLTALQDQGRSLAESAVRLGDEREQLLLG